MDGPGSTQSGNRVAVNRESAQTSCDTARRLATKCAEPNRFDRGSQCAISIKSRLKRCVFAGDVIADAEKACLDSFDEVRAPRSDIERLARSHQRVVEPTANLGIVYIKLKSSLSTPAASGHNQLTTLKREAGEPKELDGPHRFPEDQRRNIVRTRTLQCKGPNIWFVHLNIETHSPGYASGPKHDIGIGNGKPELILGQSQDDWIVQDVAVIVEHGGVSTPADSELSEVTNRQKLSEARCIAAAQFDLAFAANIPDLDRVSQVPVVDLDPAKAGRQEHVVVHGVRLHTGSLNPAGVRGAAGTTTDCKSGGDHVDHYSDRSGTQLQPVEECAGAGG